MTEYQQLSLFDIMEEPKCEYMKKNCYSCRLYGEVIDAYTCERLGYKTCFNNDAKFNYGITDVKPEDGCQFWTK